MIILNQTGGFMKKVFVLCLISLGLVGCVTGIGKKMSQSTIDEIQAGKGKLTKAQVREKIGALPQAELDREGMRCDSYAYSGVINYFVFSKADVAQSYNFCYDKTDVLSRVDGMQR